MSRPDETIRLSISLPRSHLDELDHRVIAEGYASRSEFVRDLIRQGMINREWETGRGEVIGVLTIIYDHHQRDLLPRIMETQHSRYVNVLCTTHVHLDHHRCLESIIIRGRPKEILKIATAIGGLRGVTSCGLTRAASVG